MKFESHREYFKKKSETNLLQWLINFLTVMAEKSQYLIYLIFK